jgi:arylsulfatase A-like enzyme
MRPLVAVVLALAAPGPSLAQGAGTPPNIVFILADDLGWGDLGSYGQRRIETPSLDALAARGMRFTQHYAGNAVCAPSRGVLLTGRHPGHAAVRDNRELQPEGQWPLPGPELTIAELLKPLGYATGAMGKWGLGPPGSEGDPLKQGFDHFFGYNCQRQAHGYYPSYLWDDSQRVVLGNPETPPHQKLAAGADPLDSKSYAAFAGDVYAPDVIWARARDFIRANRARPFFAFLPTTVPHLALSVPEDSLARYRGRFAETPYTGDKRYLPQQAPRAAYAAMVTRLDREVGRILDLVAELGLEERTIVVFTSDNGPTFDVGGADSAFFGSAGRFRGLKGSLYEGGLRVPAIVSWKGRVAAGATSDRVTGFEDWLPTLLELAGAAGSVPPRVDGVSFAPTLLGRAQEPRPWLYRELAGYGGQQMVRVGDWTGVRQGLAKPAAPRLELYDLASDVAQARDVAAANPDVVARLEAVLAREHQPSPFFPLAAIDPQPERYAARATKAGSQELLDAGGGAWAPAVPVRWGPDALATSFAALWSAAGLAVRFDVTDPSPWHTLSGRDERLWTEEVVELFLDVGATGRSYAEVEWNPAGAVVDLWVDRAEGRFDRSWNVAGLESRVHPLKGADGRPTGWSVVAVLPWSALAAKAPSGASLPPRAGDRWRFNAYRIERPGGPSDPEKGVLNLPWAPTGQHSFHVPEAFRELEFVGEAARD